MTYFEPKAVSKFIDYQQLRREISIQQVLNLIDWQTVSLSGPQLRGHCPVHKSKNCASRSFAVNTEKNVYHCFGCNSQGNQLDLAAALFGKELYASTLELCDRLGIKPPLKERSL